MPHSVALLRGINVGASRSLPMIDLRRICTAAGCTTVATYIQSGNVVLDHPTASGAALEQLLATAILDATGMDVPVLARTGAELASIITHNPYPGTDGTKLVVWFLRTNDDAERLAAADIAAFAPESLIAGDRAIYLSLPNGQGRSPLLTALDKVRPRVTYTARNWNTVTKLHAMIAALP